MKKLSSIEIILENTELRDHLDNIRLDQGLITASGKPDPTPWFSGTSIGYYVNVSSLLDVDDWHANRLIALLDSHLADGWKLFNRIELNYPK
jgi:hypothetical protein